MCHMALQCDFKTNATGMWGRIPGFKRQASLFDSLIPLTQAIKKLHNIIDFFLLTRIPQLSAVRWKLLRFHETQVLCKEMKGSVLNNACSQCSTFLLALKRWLRNGINTEIFPRLVYIQPVFFLSFFSFKYVKMLKSI